MSPRRRDPRPDDNPLPRRIDTAPMKRRRFLGWGAAVGTGALSLKIKGAPKLTSPALRSPRLQDPAAGNIRMIRTGCPSHNCGGRCLLKVFVQKGRIVRIESDDRAGDGIEAPQLRACIRGRLYRRRQYHPDRLLHPLKRVGKRGEGSFAPISWDEALNTMAAQLKRIKAAYGNAAIFVPYGTGSYNQINGRQTAQRLMNLFGGSLGYYNNYSWAAMAAATPTVYGTNTTGSQRQDWVHARYILMWGWNPCEMRDGTNSEYFLRQAKENGARIVCVDPRMTLSATALADEWIPIRPGTDAAMLSAMAHVIIAGNLHDTAFVRSHCLGFDETQMPAGAEGAESYKDYILGTRDGVPKTPAWAEPICGIPRGTIARLAREYASTKPAMLYQGYGLQRRAYGEQAVRAGCVLAAITGNVGISGGWAGGLGLQAPDGGPLWNVFPSGPNPVKAQIPAFLWADAVIRGEKMTAADGLIGADRLPTNIKMVYAVASNILLNQHADINRTAALLRNEKLLEFIVVQDNFLTSSARFADLVLPACTQFETWGVADGWKYGDEVLLMPKIVEPPGEAKSDFRICADIAVRLGFGEAYTEGRDERGWTAWSIDELRRARYPGLPSLDEFEASNAGVFALPVTKPAIAFADFRSDPIKHPLPTPSGRIEIFSKKLHDMGRPDEIPAVPKYVPEWENPFGPEAKAAPLQVVGPHTLATAHSTLDNVAWLKEAFPRRLAIHPVDAEARGIRDGDRVKVFNGRGAVFVACRVTRKIRPGVVALPQGAWWRPGPAGIDEHGSINVLTSARPTALAFGNAQHTIMAQVVKA
ncbi:MAG: molybdopterin-dependent oxidoreductase [Candidatus Aminicenantes bacterium]|nr:molybdopterin-dependent oxidoreductase [Candidatus Aminicenantes bacterium]